MTLIRILIVHENPLFRAGLRSTLERCEGMQIIGETVQQEQILELAATQPDVVLFDGTLSCEPSCSAVEMVAQVRRARARGIIVFAPSRDEEHLFGFLRSGAAAYVPPTISGKNLLEKIKLVATGHYLITSDVLHPAAWKAEAPERSWYEAPAVHRAPQQQPSRTPSDLTARELTILREAMKGQSNKQIARPLRISAQTVKNHMTSILRKLGAHDRTEAVVIALREQLIALSDVKASDLVLDQEALASRAQRWRTASPPAAPLAAVVAGGIGVGEREPARRA